MLINYDLTGKSGSYNIGPNSGNYLAKSKGVCREMKSEGKLAANSGLTNRNFI
jgi:hypothetical protein